MVSQDLKRNTVLKDHEGKEMLAMTIFSMSIRYLKTDFLDRLHKYGIGISESEIRWVLAVPGIWNDSAKQFMREAAQNAGINGDQMLIVLDSEAAIMLFNSASLRDLPPTSKRPGTKIMVVDDGGGIAETSVFQIQDDGTFCQIHVVSGGGWGSIQVDEAFRQLLYKIVGANVMVKFEQLHMDEYMDLFRVLEMQKRTFDPDGMNRIILRIPSALMDLFKHMTGENFKDAVMQTSYGNKLSMQCDKMRIDQEVMKGLFEPVMRDLIEHMRGLFKEPTIKDTSIIFMVGGFSESLVLQKTVKKEFRDKIVIVPDDAQFAVLKGAILYGFNPSALSARILKFTYGIKVMREFKPKRDPLGKKELRAGKEMCIDVFSKHAEKGDTLVVGQSKPELRYRSSTDDQIQIDVCLYTSTNHDPMFVTDSSCQYLGNLLIDVPKVNGKTSTKYGIWVKLIFYDTELKVEARNEITNEVTSAVFDFLG